MTLGRMIHFFHPSRSLFRIPATTVAATFVLLDVLSFVIQLVGGGMAGPDSPPDAQRRGLNIYMTGISLQEFFVVVFICLCIKFQRDMINYTPNSVRLLGFVETAWGPLLAILYTCLSLITVRIVYRLIEFSGGLAHDNPLTTNEAYFFALEAVPMLGAIIVFNFAHPGRIISGPGSEMPGFFSSIKKALFRRKGRQQLSEDSSDEQGFILKARQSKA